MLKLIDTQRNLIDKIDQLIGKKDVIFELLTQFRNKLKEDDLKISQYGDANMYIENPLNAFNLIKRLTVDIFHLKKELGIFHEETSGLTYPDENDLVGSVGGIHRLQTIYQLKTSDLSNGILDTFEQSESMSSSDCATMAHVLLDNNQHEYSEQWFTESYNKLLDPVLADISKYELLDFIAKSFYNIGDLEVSLKWQAEIKKEFPDDVHNIERMGTIRKELNESILTEQEEYEHSLLDGESTLPIGWVSVDPVDLLSYEAMCRGEYQPLPNRTKSLRCRYETKGKFYLKLFPFKVEELFLDPDIFLYHSVISDYEINHLLTSATDKQIRCEAGFTVNEDIVFSDRVCQGNLLADNTDDIVNNIANRVSRIVGLSLMNSEEFQFVRYTAGGHYGLHYDMAPTQEVLESHDDKTGNRMATAIFYLNDVRRGGAIVFPEQGVVVQPARGTALVWRNLLPSTEPDLRTLHGACPLIQGHKWIITRWFHQVGQELIAPCDSEF